MHRLLSIFIFIVISAVLVLALMLCNGYILFDIKDQVVKLLATRDPSLKDYLYLGGYFGLAFYIGMSQYKFLSNIKINWED